MEIVFVYGTLKRGHGNHILLEKSEFLGPAETNDKYVMYQAGIPFVSKAFKETRISGEVYRVDELELNHLDLLEGHPTWYKREEIYVKYINNKGEVKTTKAWLYFNEQIPHQAEVLKTGIYGIKGEESKFKSLL